MLGRYLSIQDLQEDQIEGDLDRFIALWGMGGSDNSVEEAVVLREQMAALDKAMRPLKPQEREILMRWLMGETPRELAIHYKMKPRSVSMLLLRAKDKIEANLVTLQTLNMKDKDNDRLL